MPTVLRTGPYRLFFYAGDREEPVHIHVERDDKVAKFWLDPVRQQSSGGFTPSELRTIQRILQRQEGEMMEAWREYFSEDE